MIEGAAWKVLLGAPRAWDLVERSLLTFGNLLRTQEGNPPMPARVLVLLKIVQRVQLVKLSLRLGLSISSQVAHM